MSSPASTSDLEGAFDKLHPKVQRWIVDQKWDDLREIQARTINAVLDRSGDVLLSATTAAGKTEAAFFPVLTKIAHRGGVGFSVIYISPLKAFVRCGVRSVVVRVVAPLLARGRASKGANSG